MDKFNSRLGEAEALLREALKDIDFARAEWPNDAKAAAESVERAKKALWSGNMRLSTAHEIAAQVIA